MSWLIKKITTVLLGCFIAAFAHAQPGPEVRELLNELDLSTSQREEINAVLIGGMQSLNAVNAELRKLNDKSEDDQGNADIEGMRVALVERRFRLAQSMASDILSVLDAKQLSKFDFGHLLEVLPEATGNKTWEQEL